MRTTATRWGRQPHVLVLALGLLLVLAGCASGGPLHVPTYSVCGAVFQTGREAPVIYQLETSPGPVGLSAIPDVAYFSLTNNCAHGGSLTCIPAGSCQIIREAPSGDGKLAGGIVEIPTGHTTLLATFPDGRHRSLPVNAGVGWFWGDPPPPPQHQEIVREPTSFGFQLFTTTSIYQGPGSVHGDPEWLNVYAGGLQDNPATGPKVSTGAVWVFYMRTNSDYNHEHIEGLVQARPGSGLATIVRRSGVVLTLRTSAGATERFDLQTLRFSYP